MAIVQWDPTRELSVLQGDMNRLFERFFGEGTSPGSRAQRWVPAMDVVEEGDSFVLRADLPGIAEDDLTIELQDNQLTIAGERRFEPRPQHDGGYVRLERAYGSFQRTLSLPEGVDADAIEAEFEHGVLELRIPKPAAPTARRVQIGTSRRQVEAEAGSGD